MIRRDLLFIEMGKRMVRSFVLDLVSCRCLRRVRRSCSRRLVFRVRRQERFGFDGFGVGRVGVACRLFALVFFGFEIFVIFLEGFVMLKSVVCQFGRLFSGRSRFLRERFGRVFGQAFVFYFSFVNRRRLYFVLQIDIQKSFFNCRRGDFVGVKWLDVQDRVFRFRILYRW